VISLSQDMPKPLQPNFILDVETSELFIHAGLQDRVIQVSVGVAFSMVGMVLVMGGYGCSMTQCKALVLYGINKETQTKQKRTT